MKASILIVHFGDSKPTLKCIKSIKSDLEHEIIVVDNNLKDSQRGKFANVRYFKSDLNNYCHALNFGFKKAKSDIVVVLNPDAEVAPNWLDEILKPFSDPKIAGVSSKILFKKSKRINSLGIEEIKDFYYRDAGFDEEDDPNLKPQEIKYASGCSVAYRKSAIKEVGGFDEDFVMYVEDVDMGIKLRARNYKLMVAPTSIVYHAFHGTSGGVDLPWYFCNRNRFLLIAKHHPEKFTKQIKKSHPFIHGQLDYLFEFVKAGIYKLIIEGNYEEYLQEILEKCTEIFPLDKVQNIINEIQLNLGLRKPRIAFYDHALQFIGGGQKYGCTIAEEAQKFGNVTFITNKPVTIDNLENWYDLDLSNCDLKTIELEINEDDKQINPSLAEVMATNPFMPVEDEILNYDLMINVNMVSHVNALALQNIFLCHFPDGGKKYHFYVDEYDKLITNSKYTKSWIKKKWKLEPDEIIYPPVDMKYEGHTEKENIILSVARFEKSGSKKQLELVKAFEKMRLKEWKLILAGGSLENNRYLDRIKSYIESRDLNVEVKTNLSNSDLKKTYAHAKIFWHACGLGVKESKNPNLIEHFGMTTVEAMQNGCVPVVINGGGQREIIDHGKNGFKFKNPTQLVKFTNKLIKSNSLLRILSDAASRSSKKFEKENFQKQFSSILAECIEKITAKKNFIPEAHHVYKQLTSRKAS
ncbi:glycosyltransferase [Patescibacteria group bacterium]